MKLQLLIVGLLNHLMLAAQEEKVTSDKITTGYEDIFFNYSYPDDDDDAAPCNTTVPGFNPSFLTTVYILVFAFSLIGNSIVIFVVCSMKKARASTDIYLMHLAIADLLFCLTLPFFAGDNHLGWIYGDILCKLLSAFQEASVYSGVFLLACISVDRYFAIVRATRLLSSNHLLVKIICYGVWLIAAVLALPLAIKKESLYANDLDQYICYENITGDGSYQWQVSFRVLRHTIGFFLPLMVMSVCYGWTVVTLFHTRNQQKHKAMRVILAVVLAFILCWLPHNIAVLIDTLYESETIQEQNCQSRYTVEVMRKVTEVFAFMHCAVNPVLYAFIGQKFRNQLLSTLYKHGLISKRLQMAYRKGSATGSIRSRNTSVTM